MIHAPAVPAKNIKNAMGKFKSTIILLLILLAFAAGFYFKDNIISFYESASWQIGKGVEQFQKIDIGNLITKTGGEIFSPPPLNVGGSQNQAQFLKSKVISQTNLQRTNNGLSPLVENSKLDEAAAAKAVDMFKNQYFEHVSPTGVDPGKLVQNYGYEYIVAGENLILGNFASEQEMVQDWMASPGHRANILNKRYAEIGMAVIKGTFRGESVWIAVQEFGLPLSSCPQPDNALKEKVQNYKDQLDVLSVQIETERKEVEKVNPRDIQYGGLVDAYNQLVKDYNTLSETTKGFIAQYNDQVNAFNACVAGK